MDNSNIALLLKISFNISANQIIQALSEVRYLLTLQYAQLANLSVLPVMNSALMVGDFYDMPV